MIPHAEQDERADPAGRGGEGLDARAPRVGWHPIQEWKHHRDRRGLGARPDRQSTQHCKDNRPAADARGDRARDDQRREGHLHAAHAGENEGGVQRHDCRSGPHQPASLGEERLQRDAQADGREHMKREAEHLRERDGRRAKGELVHDAEQQRPQRRRLARGRHAGVVREQSAPRPLARVHRVDPRIVQRKALVEEIQRRRRVQGDESAGRRRNGKQDEPGQPRTHALVVHQRACATRASGCTPYTWSGLVHGVR